MKFKTKPQAEKAIADMNGVDWLDKTLRVDWAFVSGP